MNQNEVKIEITCSNEDRVVGHLEVPQGGNHLLTSKMVWAKFRPITEDYRLPQRMAGDGHSLVCSRCGGLLCIKGETATMKGAGEASDKLRDEARQRAMNLASDIAEVHQHIPAKGISADLMPITLGKTTIKPVL